MKRLIALGCVLLLAACNTERPSAPLPNGGVQAARSGGGGSFAFVNFALGAAPGTVCPGSSGCTNGAAEPMIRADASGMFYVSSELGVGSGTLAWRSTDGGLHYTALTSPNQLSKAAGGVGPGGGDTDLGTAPEANASGVHNLYVASLSLANVTVSTSQDGGAKVVERLDDARSRCEIGENFARHAALQIDRLEQRRLNWVIGVDNNTTGPLRQVCQRGRQLCPVDSDEDDVGACGFLAAAGLAADRSHGKGCSQGRRHGG